MKFADYVKPENIKLQLEGRTKEEVIEELVECLTESCCTDDADTILDAVMAREREGSTGLEKGVAIPHAKSDAVSKLSIVIGISKEGIDFDALDGKRSHLFFLMVAPTSESGPHVQAIAKIVKMIKIERFRERLLKAKSGEEVLETISMVENGEM
ncbi:MAG TPA: PTS sugar transporter subunit IIA [Candidatus Eisenbacteria bacterium]|uniref:PTS sugar transporter subunit IIA n=1 Tax=Eiseniibacteriota bacterium TaxID=2212470 RepID=A0A7V2AU49_UNCEI|nr:PTS sugar transporter subunit IIA [Candidatus Eisenbacteria bacterium]